MRSSDEVQRRVESDVLAGLLRHTSCPNCNTNPRQGQKRDLAVMNWTLWLCFLFLPQTANPIALNK